MASIKARNRERVPTWFVLIPGDDKFGRPARSLIIDAPTRAKAREKAKVQFGARLPLGTRLTMKRLKATARNIWNTRWSRKRRLGAARR
jgi:hypothetical protein